MHARLDELFTYLDAERAGLRAAVDLVPPGRRDARPADGRWSVAEVLEHLTLAEHRLSGLLSERLAAARGAGLGEERDASPVLPTLDLSPLADRSVRLEAPPPIVPSGTRSAAAAWPALVAARAGLKTAMTAGVGLALGEVTHPHPRFGPLSIYGWLAFVGAHEARHAAQIREIAAALAAVPDESRA